MLTEETGDSIKEKHCY